MTLLIHADSAATIEGRKSPMVALAQWVEDAALGCFSLLVTQRAPVDPPPLRYADWVTLPSRGGPKAGWVPSLAGERLLDTYAAMYRPAVSVFVGSARGVRVPTQRAFGHRIALTSSETTSDAELTLDWRQPDQSALKGFGPAQRLLDELKRHLPLCVVLLPGEMRQLLQSALETRPDCPALRLYASGAITDELLEVVAFAYEQFAGPIELQLGLAQSLKRPYAAASALRRVLGLRDRVRLRVVSEVAPVAAHTLMQRALNVGLPKQDVPT